MSYSNKLSISSDNSSDTFSSSKMAYSNNNSSDKLFSKYAIRSFLESSTSEIVVSILLKSVIKTSKIPNVGTRVLS